jgi:hypothetical protein
VKNASNRLGVMAYALLLGKQRYENWSSKPDLGKKLVRSHLKE